MGWDTKLIYDPDATHRVTVRATAHQIANWRQGFHIYMKGTNMATFLAWAADFAIAFLRAEEALYREKEEREERERKADDLRKVYDSV